MSLVKHGIAVRTLCVRCLTTMDAVENLQCGRPRILLEIKLHRNSVYSQKVQSIHSHPLHIVCTTRRVNEYATQALERASSSLWASFYGQDGFRTKACVPDVYSVFTFESLHNFHLNISKMIKGRLFIYISYSFAAASRRTSLLRASSPLQDIIRTESRIETKNIDFSIRCIFVDLNGLYTRSGNIEVLKVTIFDQLNSIFPFLAAFLK